MVSRQIITPSQQDDVKPHEHDATEISGVFNFLRALKGIIDGSMTVNGTLTVAAGADVVIGDEDVSNSQLFVDNIQSHFNLRETDDVDYPDKIFIVDVNGGIGRIVWRDQTGAPVSTDLLHFNQDGTVEVKVGLHLVNGTEAAPSLAWENEVASGFFRDTAGEFAVAISGSEVARFTADGMVSGPLGVLGYAEVTSNQTLNSTDADLTGLSVTVDVAASRRIKITGHGLTDDVGSGRRIIEAREGSTALGRLLDYDGGRRISFDGSAIVTPSEGSHTYKLHYDVISGSDHRLEAASTAPAWILVEDIGPA